MKITIWSDFVCPFCYIGEAHLAKALESFEHAENVEIEYRSFLLSPDAEYVPGEAYYESFSNLKGIPVEQTKAMLQQVTDMAKASGVDINYDIAKFASTADAHHVFQYAKEQGKGNEFFDRLYAAHFAEGEVLSDPEAIVRLAEEVGLAGEKVRGIIAGKEYAEKVSKDIAESRQIGVQGVPFFVFNDKYAVSGAQPVPYFSQVLDTVWEEEKAEQ